MTEIPGYTILRPLGRGGMATVYLARQESLGREIALKVLTAGQADDPAAHERFLREARIAASLHHPHIVPIHDFGLHGGLAYIAMEYESGGTVAPMTGEKLPPRDALRIVRDIANALDYAHGRGVVHRDIKPDNILRRDDGAATLSDFGIARLLQGAGGVSVLTAEGTSVGTPQYMSPEQLRGDKVDGRSDLYSLGVVLWQLLTGELPYTGNDAWAIGTQHISADIPRLPPALAHLQPLLDALLAKNPEARVQSGAELAQRADALIGGTATPETAVVVPASVLPAAASGASTSPGARDPGARRTALGLGLVLLAVLAWFGWREFGTGARDAAATPAAANAMAPPARPVASTDNSIAVLPFVDMSQAKDQEYFSDGLSEELLNQLAQVPQLRVIARTSSFSFKGREVGVAEIARVLGVAHVLEGSVRKSGDTLRITAQLIRASDSSHLWSQTYDRHLTDVFKVQDEISREVVSALKLKLLPEKLPDNTQHTTDPAAYEQFLIGSDLARAGGRASVEAALAAQQRAVAIDPGYANAYAEIGTHEASMADFAPTPALRDAAITRSLAAADKAVALAPQLPDGWVARANTRFRLRWDWDGAQQDLAQALPLDPNRARTLFNSAPILFTLGKREQALALLRKAVAADPLSDTAWLALGRYQHADGDLPGAKQSLERALELNPQQNWANFLLGNLLLQTGDVEGAVAHYQLAPEQFRTAGMAMAEFTRGNDAASRQLLATMEKDYAIGFSFQIAQVYAWRGEKDQAFAWLDRAYAVHDAGLVRLPFDPAMDPLRSDPRYAALVRKMGFPK
jgi:serine/threonine-protein kinase